MADHDNVHENVIDSHIREEKKKDRNISTDLITQNSKLHEEEITGNAAIRLYDLIFNQKSDSKRKLMIKEALKRFPEPELSKELDIDI